MLQKALLAGLALLLLGLGVGAYLSADSGPDLGGPRDDAAAPTALGTAVAASAPTDAAHQPGDDGGASDRAVAAVLAEATARPLPEAPSWVEVKIVDRTTGEPLPGALVHWHDESAWEYFKERNPGADRRNHELNWHPERLAELAGWRTRSDAKGIARVTLKEWSEVSALHGGLFGKLRLGRGEVTPIGGHVVELAADGAVTVRVVDDRGTPCGDVPVTVVILDKDKNFAGGHGWAPLGRTSSPDGLATIGHLPAMTVDLYGPWTPPGTTYEARVRLMVPGVEDTGVAFDAASPPAEPIELRLPPCGSIAVRAQLAGKSLPGFRNAWMSAVRDENQSRDGNNWMREMRTTANATVGTDGVAHFAFVPLGQQFRVGGDAMGGLNTTQAGPLNAGQQVEIVLSPRDDAMMLTGVLLGPDRQPLAEQSVHVRGSGPQLNTNAELRTERDGRFVLNLGAPRKENRLDQLAFEQRTKGEVPRRAEVPGRTLRAGLEELGEIVLAEGALLVSGRLVAGGEPWCEPVSLRVMRYEPRDGTRAERWRRLDGTLVHQDGTGAFTIRGVAPPARYRLTVNAARLLPVTPVEFAPGATDVVVPVDLGLGLAASVLLPEHAPGEFVTAVLVPPAPPLSSENDRSPGERLQQQLQYSRRERHHVAWPALPPGKYTLELRLWAIAKPLLAIADVELPPPPGGDPRLADIDLRSLLRIVTVAMHEADGRTAVEGEGVAFPTAQASATEWLGYPLWSRHARLLLPPGPYDLLVAVRGFRPQPLRGDGASASLRLDRWPTIAVKVPVIPKLPEKARVQVMLQQAQASDVKYRTSWSSGDLSEYLQPQRRAVALANGVASVAIGDGLHTLRITVSANRRSHTLEGIEPQQVLPTVGEVVVTVPEAQWQKAVEVVSQPPPPQQQPQREYPGGFEGEGFPMQRR